MKISIIIPTFKNFDYLKLCINSIEKNSTYSHQIIVHINGHDEKTEKFLLDKKIIFTKSFSNIGLCSGVNIASKKSTTKYIMYSHDDMYFLPSWDENLEEEITNLNTKFFYLSLTHISCIPAVKGDLQHITFDCGSNLETFNENKLLTNFNKFQFRDLQGSHWAPHVIHKDIWLIVGGFSEEFNPGFASDPDLNMKLWNIGVRIFKGLSKSRVYHFGSVTTRKNKSIIKNNGKKTFLLKWKCTVEFFTKHYLKRGSTYNKPLTEPQKTFLFYFDLFLSKSKYFFTRYLR
jgi:glycosyltransferase involved in cell wall biosynthesis